VIWEPWGSCPECDRVLRAARDPRGHVLAIQHPPARLVRCARYSQLSPLAFVAWVEHVRRQPRPHVVAVPVGGVIWDRPNAFELPLLEVNRFTLPVFQLIGFKLFGAELHPDHRGWIEAAALEHFELVGWVDAKSKHVVPCVHEPAPELPHMRRVRPARPCSSWELRVTNRSSEWRLFVFARAAGARRTETEEEKTS